MPVAVAITQDGHQILQGIRNLAATPLNPLGISGTFCKVCVSLGTRLARNLYTRFALEHSDGRVVIAPPDASEMESGSFVEHDSAKVRINAELVAVGGDDPLEIGKCLRMKYIELGIASR